MAPSLGLILANRAVVLGAVKARDLLDIAVDAERSGVFDAVWVGDSLLAKPRLESVTLLSALAGVTERVRLAVGCLATFAHRHPVLFAQKGASHRGRFYRFEGVTLEPRPVQTPCPIWIASNPTGLTWKGGASASGAAVERGFRRVARYADGWMTNKLSPAEFAEQFGRIRAMARAEGRDPAALGSALYHSININEDRAAALAEAKAFLDTYYTAKFTPAFVEQWTVAGGPKECAQQLRAYFAAGLGHMALRLASWSQRGQLERFLGEVAPALGEG